MKSVKQLSPLTYFGSAISATYNIIIEYVPPLVQPVRNRANINQFAEFAIKTISQNTNAGIPRNVSARLHPTTLAIYPTVNVPRMPPMRFMEPIHDTSSNVNGPVSNGASGDVSSMSAGVIQPDAHPWEKGRRFAAKNRKVRKFQSNLMKLFLTRNDCVELISVIIEFMRLIN